MSLIERAARRLDQLRKAGSEVAGELAYPDEAAQGSRAEEPEDVIERAARKMREAQGGGVVVPPVSRPTAGGLPGAAAPAAPKVANATVQAASVRASGPARQVSDGGGSVPGGAPMPPASVQSAPAEAAEPVADSRRSRAIDIDFERLREKGLLTPDAAQSRLANELRVIKRPIVNNCAGKSATPVANARRIMVTSALPGEGKSFVSLNLALSIAMERDSTVLLIEGDPTRPALAEMLGIPPTRGLMDLLVDDKLDVPDVMIRTNLGRLSFISAGTRHEHATELLASSIMERLVKQLYERYPDRILLFDSPPLLAAPEPRVLAQHMGQVIYVVEAEQTPQSTVAEALSTIEGHPVVMTVLNKSTSREESYYYSYYYGSAAE